MFVPAEVHEVAVHVGDSNVIEFGAVDPFEMKPVLGFQLADVRAGGDTTVGVRALDPQITKHDLRAVPDPPLRTIPSAACLREEQRALAVDREPIPIREE